MYPSEDLDELEKEMDKELLGLLTTEDIESEDGDGPDPSPGPGPEPAPHPPLPKAGGPNPWPRTQKAKGLLELTRGTPMVVQYRWIAFQPRSVTIHPRNPMSPRPYQIEGKILFARPCPSTPRHGFLDSKTIKNIQEALDFMGEVRDLDPCGEIILMPLLTGRYSAVVTNAGITWGLGNDGATGVGNTMVVPCPVSAKTWGESCVGSDGLLETVGIKDCVYVELVEDDGDHVAVQLRDGPAQSAQIGDFIPKDFTLKKVIRPSDADHDLLKWETLVKKSAGQKGVAVLIPTEPNRAGHFAIHGILANMPVLFGKAPGGWSDDHIGKKFKASEKTVKVAKLDADAYKELAQQIMMRIAYPKVVPRNEEKEDTQRQKNEVITTIGVCHAMTAWGPEPHLLALRAEGIVNCLLYTMRACFGEVRHFYTNGPGRGIDVDGHGKTMLTDASLFLDEETVILLRNGNTVPRPTVYSNISRTCLSDQLHAMSAVTKDLRGAVGWGGSFGGNSWAESASLARLLGYALIRFCKEPDEAGWLKCSMYYNRVVNCCHNGGKILTKWCDSHAFVLGNEAPALCLMNPVAARVVLGLDKPEIGRNKIRADFRRQTSRVRK